MMVLKAGSLILFKVVSCAFSGSANLPKKDFDYTGFYFNDAVWYPGRGHGVHVADRVCIGCFNQAESGFPFIIKQ